MSKFKDRLWRELVREHGADLAQVKRPAAQHRRRARPRVLAGTTLGLAGAGTALVLVLSAASSSPAFAVTPNRDGTVQVVIERLSGISGANIKLASLGVRARIVQVVAGCKAVVWSEAVRAEGVTVTPAGTRADRVVGAGFAQVRLDPRRIPVGRTLVLPTVRAGRAIHIARANWVRGAAPACLPPLAPPMGLRPGHGRAVQCLAGPAPSGNSGNSGNSGDHVSSGKSAGKRLQVPVPSTVASGNSGNSGNSGPPPPVIPNGARQCQVIGPPPSGNSGNSGNS